jgi:hypothetical protein
MKIFLVTQKQLHISKWRKINFANYLKAGFGAGFVRQKGGRRCHLL